MEGEFGRNIFMPHDAEEILKIGMPRTEEEDFNPWTLEIFKVKSAYNLASTRSQIINPQNSSGNQNGDTCLWKSIWSANVHPKLKSSY
jgi:hypothetical protein